MTDLHEINKQYLQQVSEMKEEMDEYILSELKNNAHTDLSNINLTPLITIIKSMFKSVESKYFIQTLQILEEHNIPNAKDKTLSIIQSIRNSDPSEQILEIYLEKLESLINQLQSQIRVAPSVQGYLNGKKNKAER